MTTQSFASDLRKFAERANKSLDDTCRAVAIKWFSSTVMGTPVDTGRLRGNWQMTLGAPAQGVTNLLDKAGTIVTATIAQKVGGVGKVNYLVNNMPYAEVAEYGGWNGPTDKVTESGFSTQAPEGMVRINFIRIKSIIEQSAREHRV